MTASDIMGIIGAFFGYLFLYRFVAGWFLDSHPFVTINLTINNKEPK